MVAFIPNSSYGRDSTSRQNSPLLTRRNKPNKNVPFRRALKITTSFCLIAIFLTQLFPGVFFSIFSPIAKPFWSIRELTTSTFSLQFNFLKAKKILIEENDNLKQQLLEANIRAIRYDLVYSENQVLRGIFGTTSENRILGKIIARPFESPYDIIILDTGNNETKVGDKVLGPDSTALGEIIETSLNIAKVSLYSNPDKESHVEILRTGATLNLVGRGGGNFSVIVPKDFDIALGDIVTIPAFRSNIVARVGSIEETDADSFKKVLLSSPVNIFELSWVLISQQ